MHFCGWHTVIERTSSHVCPMASLNLIMSCSSLTSVMLKGWISTSRFVCISVAHNVREHVYARAHTHLDS